jgi:ribose transport system permease protein
MTAARETLPTSSTQPNRRIDLRAGMEAIVPLIALVLLVVATATCERWFKGSSNFLKLENILNLLRQYSPVGIVAISMTFVIISGGIDLSVGSMVAMAGCFGLWTMNLIINATSIISDMADARQFNSMLPYSTFTEWLAKHAVAMNIAGNEMTAIWIGVGVMLIVALLAGTVNGTLVAKGRVAPFIATLGGFAAYRSIAVTLAEAGTLSSGTDKFLNLSQNGITLPLVHVRPDTAAVIYYPVIIFFTLAIVAAVLLNKTRYGRYVIAIGSNERSAIYSAINVDRVKMLTYLLIGFFCGVAALLLASRQNSMSSPQAGSMYELDAIAAVVIGGTRMSGGSGTIFGTVIGVLILGVISNMLSFLDVSTNPQGLVKGIIIVVAVLIQRMGRRATV